ncbi:MAG TPA: hypothetical protein VLA36_05310 [Longimicrobiales bacterium]|nr:hypothetical protein [Longimicrobiales bacterium]
MALAVLAGGADAQRRSQRPAGYVGLALVAAGPLGELGDYIDAGGGGQFYGMFPLDPDGRVRLRADFGFLVYGHERQRLCFSYPVGCRIQMDLTTTNAVMFGGLGPEVVLGSGPVEPYLNASFGFSYFTTTSSLSGDNDFDEFASTTNFDDAVFAWRAGGGVRIQLSKGRRPVALDLGVERHENGVAEFLTKGDIVDHPDGSITLFPNRSEANLVTFRVGVTLGIPQGRRNR